MTKEEAIKDFYSRAESVFWDRHKKYGTKGMDLSKAISLARTKLDRIENGEIEDSSLDLANYGLIISLLSSGLWQGDSEPTQEQRDLLVHQDGAAGIQAPKKAGDCGYDLVCQVATTIPPRGQNTVDLSTGVKVKVPDGYWGLIVNRSSTPRKKQLMVMSGVIDSGYIGELFACVWNYSDQEVSVQPGERLAQLILIPATVRPLVPVVQLPSTERGETGFGSTNI